MRVLHGSKLVGLAIHSDEIRIHSCGDGRFDNGPVLRVGVEVSDVPATLRPHETRSSQLAQELSAQAHNLLHRRRRYEVLLAER